MKTVDKYLAIVAIGIIYTFFSFLYEFHAEPEKKRIPGTLVPSFLVRALHGIVSVYLSFYIFFFYKEKKQAHHYVFLVFAFLIVLQWNVIKTCILQILEWKFYDREDKPLTNTEFLHFNITNKRLLNGLFIFNFLGVLYLIKIPLVVKLLLIMTIVYLFLISQRKSEVPELSWKQIKINMRESFLETSAIENAKKIIRGESSIETFI
mgnify:CR=1 FL=1